MAVVVDDILFVTNSPPFLDAFTTAMTATYNIKQLGRPRYMIGLKVRRSRAMLHLSQAAYVHDMASRFGQADAAPVTTPAIPSGCLASPPVADSNALDPVTHPYLSLVGSLLWVTITRPDVATANELAPLPYPIGAPACVS